MIEGSINNDEEIINQLNNIVLATKTAPANSPSFLKNTYDWMYGQTEQQRINKAVSYFGKLVDFSKQAKDKAVLLVINAKKANNMERTISYLASKGESGTELAKYAIKQYLKEPKLNQDKLNRCLMLAAKFGDKNLYDLAVKKGGRIYDSENHLITNDTGKNILHYACQSENAELVKEIADQIKTHVKNPFTIRDDANNLVSSLNYLRPQHYISYSLAEKLDHLYGLNGNKQGSFSSMANYYTTISKVLGQGFMNYLGGKMHKDEEAVKASMYSGKYLGGMWVVKDYTAVEASQGIVIANIACGVAIGAAALVSSVIIFACKKIIREKRAERLGFSPNLILNPTLQKQQNKVIPKKYDNKSNSNHNLQTALTYHDFVKVSEIINRKSFKNISSSLLKIIDDTHYFPNQHFKEKFFTIMAKQAKPKEFEDLLYSLANRCKEDKILAKKIITQTINKANNIKDLAILKRATLMAAEFGDIQMLDSAIAKLRTHGVTSLLSIRDDKGSTLMHYATRNGSNVDVILHLEPRLSQEFKLVNKAEKEDHLLGIKIRKSAQNIFEISNDEHMKPKYSLRRETANELDRAYGINIAKERGFSAYVNEDLRKGDREKKGIRGGIVAGFTILTGALAIAVPPVIIIGSKLAQALGTEGIYELPIAAAVEAAATIAALEVTEKFIIPGFASGINRVSNALYSKIYNYDFTIEAFSSCVSELTKDAILKMSVNLENTKTTPLYEKDPLKALKNMMLATAKFKDADTNNALKIFINNIIDKTIHDPKHSDKTDKEKADELISQITELSKNMLQAHIDRKQDLFNDIGVKFYQDLEKTRDFSQIANLTKEYQRKLDLLAELNPDESFVKQVNKMKKKLDEISQITPFLGHKITIETVQFLLAQSMNPSMKTHLAQAMTVAEQEKFDQDSNPNGLSLLASSFKKRFEALTASKKTARPTKKEEAIVAELSKENKLALTRIPKTVKLATGYHQRQVLDQLKKPRVH